MADKAEQARIGVELTRGTSGSDPFSAAVRATRMPMVITDPRQHDNPIVFVNEAFVRLTGYEREEILGRNCRFLQGELTDRRDVDLVRQAISERKQIELDLRNQRKDGTAFWNRLLISPVFDGEELIFFFASQYDVTFEREQLVRLQEHRDALESEVDRRAFELTRSESQLAFTLKAGRLGAWSLDLATYVLTASPVCKENYGRSSEKSFTYEDFLSTVHPDDLGRMKSALAASIASGSDYDIEYRILDTSGAVRWVLVQGQPSYDADGRPLTMVGISLDVTRRKDTEAALSESEARFRNMSDFAPVMVWTTDPSGYCTYLNARWCEFTGQSREEGLGFGWLDATHPDDRAMAEAIFVDSNARAAPFRLEYRLRQSNGVYRWAIDAAAPRFSDDGRFLGYIGSVIDIDDRKTMEAALEASNERFRGAIAANEGVIWTNDASGRMLGNQTGWTALTGQSYDEYQGYGWAKAVHPDDAQPTIDAWSEAVRERKTFIFEHRVRRHDGEWRQFSIRAVPLINAEGEVREWVGVHTDITDRKQADEHRLLLTRELTHRVKNTMATVQAIVGQTLRSAATVEEATDAINARIGSLSEAHNVLTREQWQGALLVDVVEQALAPFRSGTGDRFSIEGPKIKLRPRTALAFAMATHELATNAVKYGALSVDAGRVAIGWSVIEENEGESLAFTWRETGGPVVVVPTRKGFGSRMIERALASELTGTARIEFNADGIHFEARAPLARVTEEDALPDVSRRGPKPTR